MSADRLAVAAERRYLEPAPAPQVRRAAEKVPLEERHQLDLGSPRVDRTAPGPHGDRRTGPERLVVASLGGELVVVGISAHPAAGLFEVERGEISVPGVEDVLGRVPAE